MHLKFLSAFVLLTFSHLLAFSQSSLIDNSFGINGMAQPRFDKETTSSNVVIDKKNRLFFSREITLPGGDHAIELQRYTSSGQLDASFDGDGKRIINLAIETDIYNYEYVETILFQGDHKIMLYDYNNTNNMGSWVRLNEDGSMDNTFGTNGLLENLFEGETATLIAGNKLLEVDDYKNGVDGIYLLMHLANGTPDNSFGSNGSLFISNDDLDIAFGDVSSLVVQFNGKILIIGSDDEEDEEKLLILRLNANGSIDNSYGINGQTTFYAATPEGDPYYFYFPQLTHDGKLLLSGAGDDIRYTAFLRLTDSGQPDNTFATNGLFTRSTLGNTNFYYTAFPSSTGATWIGGFSKVANQYDYMVSKLNANGSPDNSFGNNGIVKIDLSVHADDLGYIAMEQTDGKLLLAGYSPSNGFYDLATARLLSTGTLDNSFATGGVLRVPFVNISQAVGSTSGSEKTNLVQSLVLPDGKTLFTGVYDDGGYAEGSIYVSRLLENGAIDNSFGIGGKATITPLFGVNTGNYGEDNIEMATLPDGSIVLACNVQDIFYGSVIMLVKLTAAGQLDASFGNNGRTLQSVGLSPFNDFTIKDFKAAPNGKLSLIVVYEEYDMDLFTSMVFQFLSTGLPDTSYALGGRIFLDFHGNTLAYATDNKLVVLGYNVMEMYPSNEEMAVQRFNTNGTADNSFNSGNARPIPANAAGILNLFIEANNAVTIAFDPADFGKEYAIAKLGSNGLPLPGWGTNGILSGNLPASFYWKMAIRNSSGDYLFVGDPNYYEINVLNVLANGNLNNSFGTNGLGTSDLFNLGISYYELKGIGLQPSGKLLAAGNGYTRNSNYPINNALFFRINTPSSQASASYTLINAGNWSNPANWQNGQVPPSTISNGMQVYINPGGNGEAVLDINVVVQEGGKINVLSGKKLKVSANLTIPGLIFQ